MNFLEVVDRKLMEIASNAMRETLDERALDFLINNPPILKALIVLRQVGKFEISEKEAKRLVVLGIMQVDDQGYFLSEVVEDLIDYIIAKAETMKREKTDAPT